VLDNARAQVEAARTDDDAATDDATVVTRATAVAAPDELPPPDASDYEGANRVVNLWVGPGGETGAIDVWGRRTFTNGPILLVDGLAFGEASEYFSAPPGYRLSIVGSGAGPDGEELAGVFNAADGEQLTTIYTNDDEFGGVWSPNLWEIDPSGTAGAPDPPAPGRGLVWWYAPNTRSFSESLVASIGGDAFYVGDGSGECVGQRVEAAGFPPAVLGGTQSVELELPPGPATLTLHPWFSPEECGQFPVLEVTVDVAADDTVLVLVYSPDGTTITTLELPVG
jgi:hypothetical protein